MTSPNCRSTNGHDAYLNAALQLHRLIRARHSRGGRIVGPDPGLRLNARAWRFAKSYLGFIPWRDEHYFMQAQGYWIWINCDLARITGDDSYLEEARWCALGIIEAQREDGSWAYPLPQWGGRIATVEGCYAALGLLKAFDQFGEEQFLNGARQWHGFVNRSVGYQRYGDGLAINYFAGHQTALVPNNATLVIKFLDQLAAAMDHEDVLAPVPGLVHFLLDVQTPSGELPYSIGNHKYAGRPHFLCYQYNAFQFLDLAHYHESSGDISVLPILAGLARFLITGMLPEGRVKYACGQTRPEVVYYTAAAAAALGTATRMGLGDYAHSSQTGFEYILHMQRSKGGFIWSRRNYGILRDARSYPRYLCMILKHLLMKHEMDRRVPVDREAFGMGADLAEPRDLVLEH